jgi:DNA-binding transcriptional ArsR family regulator
MTNTLEIASAYAEAGLSVISIRPDGSKATFGEWKAFQSAIAGPDERRRMFSNGAGIGIIGGRVSGNLEIIDFDEPAYYERFLESLQAANGADLLARLPLVKTPRGFHLYLRCDTAIDGNQKLAQHLDENQKIKTAIETRGERGYVVAPGSPPACHPLNQTYEIICGDLCNIPTITADERQNLLATARTLDAYTEKKIEARKQERAADPTEGRPGDDFNMRATWPEILGPHGWKRISIKDDEEQWQRPDKAAPGISATTNYKSSGLFYVFSTNTMFEVNRGYSKFSVYAILNHNGDFQAAARELAGKGYGEAKQQPKADSQKPAGFQPPAHWEMMDYAHARTWNCKPLEPIIKGLGIFKGILILIAAQSQTGKSLLKQYLIRRMITGGLCFGKFSVEKIDKLLDLVLEDPSRRNRDRWLDQNEPDIEPGHAFAYFAPGFKLNDDNFFAHLEKKIESGFELIFIDTYQRATPGISSFNDEQQSVILHKLAELTRKYNVTIIIIDHIRKGDNGKRRREISIEDIKGTGGKAQNADTVILLERTSGKLKFTATSKDLDAPVGFLLDVAPQGSTGEKFTYAGDLEDMIGAQKQKGKENRERILQAIGEQWITREDLEKLVSMGRSTVAKHLSKLFDDGLLEKKGTGKAIYYRRPSVRDEKTLWTQE